MWIEECKDEFWGYVKPYNSSVLGTLQNVTICNVLITYKTIYSSYFTISFEYKIIDVT